VRRDMEGTGLGLAITGRAFRLHGGRVTAANAAGGGLVVSLELPILNSILCLPVLGSKGVNDDLLRARERWALLSWTPDEYANMFAKTLSAPRVG